MKKKNKYAGAAKPNVKPSDKKTKITKGGLFKNDLLNVDYTNQRGY